MAVRPNRQDKDRNQQRNKRSDNPAHESPLVRRTLRASISRLAWKAVSTRNGFGHLTSRLPLESKRTIYVSIACDLAIAGAKFLAAGLTGSSAMLSEGIHSVVDSCNGILLLWGVHASSRAPDADHPFGYGKELYFWTLIVAVLIFSIGGGMSIYEGISDLHHGGKIERAAWNYVVLGFAAIFEIVTVICRGPGLPARARLPGVVGWRSHEQGPYGFYGAAR